MSQYSQSQDDEEDTSSRPRAAASRSLRLNHMAVAADCKTKYPDIDFGPDTVEGLCRLTDGWINAPKPSKSPYKDEEKSIKVGQKMITPYERCRKLISDTNESHTVPKLQKLQRIMPYFGYQKILPPAKAQPKARGGKTTDKPEKLWKKNDGSEVSLNNEQIRERIHEGITREYPGYEYVNDRCFLKDGIYKSYKNIYDEIYSKLENRKAAAKKPVLTRKRKFTQEPSSQSQGQQRQGQAQRQPEQQNRAKLDYIKPFLGREEGTPHDFINIVIMLVHGVIQWSDDIEGQFDFSILEAIKTYAEYAENKKNIYISRLRELLVPEETIMGLLKQCVEFQKNNLYTKDDISQYIQVQEQDEQKTKKLNAILAATVDYLKTYKPPTPQQLRQAQQQQWQQQVIQQQQQSHGQQQVKANIKRLFIELINLLKPAERVLLRNYMAEHGIAEDFALLNHEQYMDLNRFINQLIEKTTNSLRSKV